MVHDLQEGGWGWFAVLATFTVTFMQAGTYKSIGVLLPHLSLQFDADMSVLGWCAGVYSGLGHLMGKFSYLYVFLTHFLWEGVLIRPSYPYPT